MGECRPPFLTLLRFSYLLVESPRDDSNKLCHTALLPFFGYVFSQRCHSLIKIPCCHLIQGKEFTLSLGWLANLVTCSTCDTWSF